MHTNTTALILVLAACTAAPAPEPPMTLARAAVAAPGPLETVLDALPSLVPAHQPTPAPDLFSGVASMTTPGRGDPGFQILTEPRPCAVPPGRYTPFMSCEGRAPQVGVPWRLTAWTQAVPAPDTGMAWLVVSWRPLAAPVDVSGLGAPGCHLLVNLDDVAPVPVGVNNALLQRSSQSPGRMTLTWTPTADSVGRSVWFQLVVDEPDANALGLVVGTALRVTVQP